MSSSILRALAWSYGRQVGPYFVFAVAALTLAPLVFTGLMTSSGIQFDAESIAPKSFQFFHFSYLGTAFLVLAFVAGVPHVESLKRMYALPVATRSLVVWIAGSAVTVAVVGNLVCLMIFGLTFEADWPMLGTSLAIATGVCVLVAMAIELTHFRLWSTVLSLVLAVSLVAWLASRYFPDGFRAPMQLWRVVTLGEFIVLAGVCTGSIVVAVRAMRRDRCGAANRAVLLAEVDWWAGERRMIQRVDSASQAITQYYRHGVKLAAVCSPVLFALMLFFTCFVWQRNPPRNLFNSASAVLIAFSSLCGMTFAAGYVTPKSKVEMDKSVSTMPINNARLASAKLRSFVKSALSTWLVLATSVSLAYAVSVWQLGIELFPVEARSNGFAQFGWSAIPLVLVASMLACWTIGGLFSALVWTGRPTLLLGLTYGGVAVAIAAIAMLKPFVSPQQYNVAWQVGVWTAAGLAITVSAYLFAKALIRSLVNAQSIAISLTIWAVASATCWITAAGDLKVAIQLAMMSMMSALPIAAAPLAIEWNRHR